MTARETILARIAAQGHAANPPAASRPSSEPVNYPVCFERFAELAATTQMTAERLASELHVATAVSAYLKRMQLPRQVVLDATLSVPDRSWNEAGLRRAVGNTSPDGDVYISAGLAAIAECGAVVIASGAGRALRNDFLARTHIVVIPGAALLASFAEFWAMLREHRDKGPIPREYCMVTGPSRTADLGVPAKLGAHGPARVHVLVVDN